MAPHTLVFTGMLACGEEPRIPRLRAQPLPRRAGPDGRQHTAAGRGVEHAGDRAIEPDARLSPAQKAIIEVDFGMADGHARRDARSAGAVRAAALRHRPNTVQANGAAAAGGESTGVEGVVVLVRVSEGGRDREGPLPPCGSGLDREGRRHEVQYVNAALSWAWNPGCSLTARHFSCLAKKSNQKEGSSRTLGKSELTVREAGKLAVAKHTLHLSLLSPCILLILPRSGAMTPLPAVHPPTTPF